jgi:hypothetical protein
MPDIAIVGGDGDFSAYLATPESGNGAGIQLTDKTEAEWQRAFTRNDGIHYDADAAKLAHGRTADAFAAALK